MGRRRDPYQDGTMAVAVKEGSPIFSLPLFLTQKNKIAVGAIAFSLAGVFYMPPNHFPLLTPQLLPMTAIDRAIPFLPYSFWIYTSEYLFFAAIYLACMSMTNLNKFLYSFVLLQAVSAVIFWIWPTTYPRHLFPLPETLDPFTYQMFNGLRQADSPNNCCPSLHVSSVYLSSFIYLDDDRKKFPVFFVWATAIAISTLTTKQHYLADVVTGFLMACVFYWIFHRFSKVRYFKSGYSA